jgi:hypothetical protein
MRNFAMIAASHMNHTKIYAIHQTYYCCLLTMRYLAHSSESRLAS